VRDGINRAHSHNIIYGKPADYQCDGFNSTTMEHNTIIAERGGTVAYGCVGKAFGAQGSYNSVLRPPRDWVPQKLFLGPKKYLLWPNSKYLPGKYLLENTSWAQITSLGARIASAGAAELQHVLRRGPRRLRAKPRRAAGEGSSSPSRPQELLWVPKKYSVWRFPIEN
jgi:hypothetical protein